MTPRNKDGTFRRRRRANPRPARPKGAGLYTSDLFASLVPRGPRRGKIGTPEERHKRAVALSEYRAGRPGPKPKPTPPGHYDRFRVEQLHGFTIRQEADGAYTTNGRLFSNLAQARAYARKWHKEHHSDEPGRYPAMVPLGPIPIGHTISPPVNFPVVRNPRRGRAAPRRNPAIEEYNAGWSKARLTAYGKRLAATRKQIERLDAELERAQLRATSAEEVRRIGYERNDLQATHEAIAETLPRLARTIRYAVR